VVLIRVDKLVALSRETVRQVTNLDKLWKESILESVKPVDEIWYGSSTGTSSNDSDQWTYSIKTNYEFAHNELSRLVTGKLEKEQPKPSYEDAWAAFFKT
jgi:hypothetical protein